MRTHRDVKTKRIRRSFWIDVVWTDKLDHGSIGGWKFQIFNGAGAFVCAGETRLKSEAMRCCHAVAAAMGGR